MMTWGHFVFSEQYFSSLWIYTFEVNFNHSTLILWIFFNILRLKTKSWILTKVLGHVVVFHIESAPLLLCCWHESRNRSNWHWLCGIDNSMLSLLALALASGWDWHRHWHRHFPTVVQEIPNVPPLATLPLDFGSRIEVLGLGHHVEFGPTDHVVWMMRHRPRGVCWCLVVTSFFGLLVCWSHTKTWNWF